MALAVRKRGRFWYARGTVPMRQADGRIARIRIEESLRTERRTDALRKAADLDRYYYELAHRPGGKGVPTFAEAALTYLQTRGKPDRFLPKVLRHFGETPIDQIDQAAITSAAHTLYPGRSTATHNRAVFAPTITILRLAGRRPDVQRPRLDRKQRNIPGEQWFDQLLPHCPPRLAALLVFLTLTGRRITEALEAIDNGDGTASIGHSKSGNPILVPIPAACLTYLSRDDGQRSVKLFPYGDRHNVYRALRSACKRAGVEYYGTHALGRHAFATRLLKQGKSLKFVADAGGWASIKMPAQHYAHLEHSEVQDEVKALGDSWGKEREKARKGNKNNIG